MANFGDLFQLVSFFQTCSPARWPPFMTPLPTHPLATWRAAMRSTSSWASGWPGYSAHWPRASDPTTRRSGSSRARWPSRSACSARPRCSRWPCCSSGAKSGALGVSWVARRGWRACRLLFWVFSGWPTLSCPVWRPIVSSRGFETGRESREK